MGLKTSLTLLTLALFLQTCFAPPVSQSKKENEENADESQMGGLEDYMEYHRYLKEVVNALESDPDFRQKLEKANEHEIKSGRIAEELQFVSHHVRTRLDEIKRVELLRLKELVEKKIQLEQGNSIEEDPTHHHLDQTNPHTFEIEDLKKLIAKTTEDLAEADKKRKEEFKAYELEKEYQKQDKLNHTNGTEKEELEKKIKEMEEKHKKHEKLHEPGHKAQLEEVWEEQDQMQQDFDPKTFFMLHDIDGNGLWDQEEVKALFIKELDKMYQQGAPEDDMRERIEEMERMRETVFKEMDVNRDGFIEYKEFLQQTNTNEFKQDHGWQGLDEQTKPYTDEELAEYIRRHHQANQIPQYGHPYPQGVPPAAYQQVPPGGYQQVPYQGAPQGAPQGYQQVPSNQQFHPGQVPQMAPQHLDLNTNEVYPQQQQHQQAYQQPPQLNQPIQQQPQAPYQQQYQQPNVVPNQQQNPNQYQQNAVPQLQQPNVVHNQQQNPNQRNVVPQQPQLQQPNVVHNQQQNPNQQNAVPQQPQVQQPNVVNNQQQQNVRPQQPVGYNQQPNVVQSPQDNKV